MRFGESQNVAKKNANDSNGGAAPRPRRAATTRKTSKTAPAAAPVDFASVTPVETIANAHDNGNVSAESAYIPTYDDIAQAAYQRYLSRGGGDGRDFDDWIEAERDLRTRRT
jgi:hypothetical protein